MKKLAHSLPLQDMLRNVIAASTEKYASDQDAAERQMRNAISSNDDEEETDEDQSEDEVNDIYVEKLASACDFIANNLGAIEFPVRGTIQKMAERAESVGAGRGAGALETSKSIGGQQSYKKDKAKTDDPSESEASSSLSAAGLPGGKTQLDNNMHKAPGNNSGKTPKTTYPAEGVLKAAGVRGIYESMLEKDALSQAMAQRAMAGALNRGGSTILRNKNLLQSKTMAHSVGKTEDVASKYKGYAKPTPGAWKRAPAEDLKAGTVSRDSVTAPGAYDKAKDWVGGQYGKTKKWVGENPGKAIGIGAGTAALGAGAGYLASEKNASIRQRILSKLAGEDVFKANIDGGGTVNPLAGKGQLKSTMTGESGPSQSGDHKSGDGNQARKLIASNAAAINATKRDAKGPVKSQLKEVLDEPALSASTDSVLQKNLRNTGKAGVKIAAAKAALTKIAQSGCQCEGSGECSYCQLKTAIKGRGSEKTANMGGMGGMGMPAPKPMGMNGGGKPGGMTAMADAGAAADGCTCGGMGECRVCKVKGALASARGEDANPVEKDALGDQVPMGGM